MQRAEDCRAPLLPHTDRIHNGLHHQLGMIAKLSSPAGLEGVLRGDADATGTVQALQHDAAWAMEESGGGGDE